MGGGLGWIEMNTVFRCCSVSNCSKSVLMSVIVVKCFLVVF